MNEHITNTNKQSYTQIYFAGVIYASMVTATGHPFDLVKARIQSNIYNTTSVTKCISQSIKTDGILGLYRGAMAPFLSHIIKRPYQYPIVEYLKTLPNTKSYHNYLYGAITGSTTAFIGTPLQVIKVGMQTTDNKNYKTTSEYVRYVYRKYSLRGFYRGFRMTFVKDLSYSSIYLGTYFTIRDTLGTDKIIYTSIAGICANVLTWTLLIPIDTVKTLIQKPGNKKNITETVNYVYSVYGIKGFWRGLIPIYYRTIPVAGISMIGYEFIKKF
jgi:hypothetical protein